MVDLDIAVHLQQRPELLWQISVIPENMSTVVLDSNWPSLSILQSQTFIDNRIVKDFTFIRFVCFVFLQWDERKKWQCIFLFLHRWLVEMEVDAEVWRCYFCCSYCSNNCRCSCIWAIRTILASREEMMFKNGFQNGNVFMVVAKSWKLILMLARELIWENLVDYIMKKLLIRHSDQLNFYSRECFF